MIYRLTYVYANDIIINILRKPINVDKWLHVQVDQWVNIPDKTMMWGFRLHPNTNVDKEPQQQHRRINI